jgi:hypothetical protein
MHRGSPESTRFFKPTSRSSDYAMSAPAAASDATAIDDAQHRRAFLEGA